MKMITAEIMSQVDKKKATEFCLKMRELWTDKNQPPSYFGPMVKRALNHIGIVANFTDGTANAVCTRMERKARIEI